MAQPPDWIPSTDQATVWIGIWGVLMTFFGVRGRAFRSEIKAEHAKLWDEIRSNRISADARHEVMLTTVASKADVTRLDAGIQEVRTILLSAARRRASD